MALPPLEVRIDADDRGLQRGLDRAQGGIRKFAAFAGGAFSGLGLGIASAVAGVVSFSAAIDGAKQAMGEFDALAKRARVAGLSSDFYQVLQLAAEEAGVAQGALNGGLVTFVKRVGEAQAGVGALAGILKKTRPDLLEQLKITKSQEEAFLIVAEAIGSLDDAQQQMVLNAAAFSKANAGMIEMMRNGRKGFDDTAKKARELGLVIDKSLLDKSEKINNDFGVATRVISIHFKRALIAIAPAITKVATFIANLVVQLDKFINRFRNVETAPLDELNRRLAETRAEQERLSNLAATPRNVNDRKVMAARAADLEKEIKLRKELAKESEKIFKEPKPPGLEGGDDKTKTKGGKVDELGDRFKALAESLLTREEMIRAQYDKDLALLEAYHERQREIERANGEINLEEERKRKDQRMRLEKNFNMELGEVRRKELLAQSNALLGGFEALFQALGSRNKKMLRMAKIVGAARAMVSTLIGAAKALEQGFPYNIAAAAMVMAKGIAFVQAIKGTGEGGTSSTGGGGGGSVRGTPAAAPVTQEGQRSTAAVINLSGGDMFSRDQVVSLINSINEAMEDGARLRIA